MEDKPGQGRSFQGQNLECPLTISAFNLTQIELSIEKRLESKLKSQIKKNKLLVCVCGGGGGGGGGMASLTSMAT